MPKPRPAPEPVFRAPLRSAIKNVGGQSALERKTGIPQQTISWLLRLAPQISAEHAVAIERAEGSRVHRSDFRPDLFDAPAPSKATEAA
jgi:DNA-binding transcriptional regulator YdaS (Cro superfamily)